MISVLILENQEPGDCAACPLFFKNAGVCSWTLRFDDPCPLKKVETMEYFQDFVTIDVKA